MLAGIGDVLIHIPAEFVEFRIFKLSESDDPTRFARNTRNVDGFTDVHP